MKKTLSAQSDARTVECGGPGLLCGCAIFSLILEASYPVIALSAFGLPRTSHGAMASSAFSMIELSLLL